MGNSIRRVGLLSTVGAGEDEPFHFRLGRKVSIDLSERQFKVKRSTGMWSEKWTMSYSVDLSTCTLSLTRSGKDEGANGLLIELLNVTSDKDGSVSEFGYDLNVQTDPESDALVHTCSSNNLNGSFSSLEHDYSKQIHEGGGVTDTSFYLVGMGDVVVFTVLEKKKMIEEEPYAVTLAHYFVNSGSINDFSRNKTDVGLSVVVKIRRWIGNLDITVGGPDQHPTLGLRYLFDEAMRNKIWKPTLCPHCANMPKQRSTMIWQSDSDDNESVPVARRHGSSKKNLRTMNNGGTFNGHDNGNYTENSTKNRYKFYGTQYFTPSK